MEKKAPARQFELSKLMNDSKSNILDRTLSEGFAPIKNATEKIDTNSKWAKSSMSDVAEKVAQHRAMRQMGKKAMGVIPFAGAAYAAMSGDPAMAADEMAGDVPVVGQAYEAFKSEDAGNRDEEREMLNERNAQVNYENSPARQARMMALANFGK